MSKAHFMKSSDWKFAVILKIRPAPLAVLLKKILRIQRVLTKTQYGLFWVDPASLIGRELIKHGVFEHQLAQELEKLLKPGSTFVDLGANEGIFSVLAGRIVGTKGRVLAIEPQERTIPIILRNLELNNLSNVEISQVAVSDKKGMAQLYLAPDTNTGSSGFTNVSKYALPSQETKIDTLDNVLKAHKIECVDCIKIDIEGAEYETVFGSKELFKSHRIKAIAIELHPTALAARNLSANDIKDFLIEAGYEHARNIEDHFWIFHI